MMPSTFQQIVSNEFELICNSVRRRRGSEEEIEEPVKFTIHTTLPFTNMNMLYIRHQ